ncbi:EamA family transporter RarD [Caulobacter sp. RL271]|jgi:chloramphenicol-sensitive protein RarD|uniref:EamA family transporter RarD n=1 Tax=Caulobacter segnis TaxID=88688 RepID=A0ABY4ZU27_9CAUL|nr:EamA family transporter RarD [Caulobacter segnis]USQ96322.1 EamA family transporter RarD [Caulobacter segnis]
MAADVNQTRDEGRAALIAGVGCYTLWGFLPLYFHLLSTLGVGSWEMIAHRTLWAAPWALLIVLLARQGGQVAAVLRQPKTLFVLALSTLAIFVNWSIYVFAVNAGHVIETSLGYYINPLMNVAAGALLFRERISREGAIAIGLAAVGVAIQTAALGHLPVISLGVALSFCLYAILRKQVKADAQTGLFIECAYLAVPGLLYVLHLQATGAGHLGASPGVTALLLLAGPATVVPLALFAWSARRMPLSAMGFLQFIAPTLQFAVGVALGEPFTPLRALSFVFIWLGVATFAYGAWKKTRQLSPA